MVTDTLTMWWPHPDAFDEMTVEDWEHGYTFVAPDDSPAGKWLAFWNQSPEHAEFFTEEFLRTLTNHVQQNGKAEAIVNGPENDRIETQKDSAGV